MRRANLAFAAACLAGGLLQAEVHAPKIGVARFPNGSVRTVYGLHSNLVVGTQIFAHSDAASFSDKGGLISSNGYIQLVAADGSPVGEYQSDETNPVLNVDGELTSAVAWLPLRHSVIHWNGSSFTETEVTGALPGAVTSVRMQSPEAASLFTASSEGQVFEASVSLESGNFISMNPVEHARGYTFAQGSFVLFGDKKGLELGSADQSVKTIPVSASGLSIERMGTEWLHLYSATTNQHWALHLNRTTVELSEIPGVLLSASPMAATK